MKEMPILHRNIWQQTNNNLANAANLLCQTKEVEPPGSTTSWKKNTNQKAINAGFASCRRAGRLDLLKISAVLLTSLARCRIFAPAIQLAVLFDLFTLFINTPLYFRFMPWASMSVLLPPPHSHQDHIWRRAGGRCLLLIRSI